MSALCGLSDLNTCDESSQRIEFTALSQVPIDSGFDKIPGERAVLPTDVCPVESDTFESTASMLVAEINLLETDLTFNKWLVEQIIDTQLT